MVRDDSGDWKALFLVPGQAPFWINQNNDSLREWEPIFALTNENLERVVEQIAQRVAAILQDQGLDHGEIVSKAMGVVDKETVGEAIEAAVEATEEGEPPSLPENPDYYVGPEYKVNKKEYTCGICDKKYAYEKSLRSHISKSHDILEEALSQHIQ